MLTQSDGSRRQLLGLRLLLVVAGALLAVGIAVRWSRQGPCYERYHAFDREQVGDDGLRHYVPDGCEIDANGYRNPQVPQHADVVAMGDSNTWGANVRSEDTWPRVLASKTGLSVYNLSMPGWGPIDFLAAMPRALALTPRFVVIGLYTGNDVYDAYARVVTHPDAYVRLTAPFQLPPNIGDDPVWQTAEDEGRAAGVIADSAWAPADFAAAETKDPNRVHAISIDGTHVIITAHYRLLGVNLDEPRIAFGLTVTKAVLATLDTLARAGGAQLVVVIQPSKEYIYCSLVPSEQRPGDWAKVCRFEAELTEQVEKTLRGLSVPYANALAELRGAAERGTALFSWGDAHLDAPGVELIADVARRALPASAGAPS